MDADGLVMLAALSHEVNRTYCRSIGQPVTAPWPKTDAAYQDAVISGVRFILENPDMTPEQEHEAFLAYKKREGWVYGPVDDPVAKTHPNIVPFGDLPSFQRDKRLLFRMMTLTLIRLAEEADEGLDAMADFYPTA